MKRRGLRKDVGGEGKGKKGKEITRKLWKGENKERKQTQTLS